MSYRLTTKLDAVVRTSDSAWVVDGTPEWAAYQEWLAGGNQPEPVNDALETRCIDAIQKRLDAFAQTRGYDNILSACTYATSKVEKFRVEGQYCIDQRDATWATCWQLLHEVSVGLRPRPSAVSEVIALMPPLEWPV